jgi:hypothetical protein
VRGSSVGFFVPAVFGELLRFVGRVEVAAPDAGRVVESCALVVAAVRLAPLVGGVGGVLSTSRGVVGSVALRAAAAGAVVMGGVFVVALVAALPGVVLIDASAGGIVVGDVGAVVVDGSSVAACLSLAFRTE